VWRKGEKGDVHEIVGSSGEGSFSSRVEKNRNDTKKEHLTAVGEQEENFL